MGAQQHGLPRVAGLAHHREELPLHERIEAAGRLVEHQQIGPVHERLDESELLLVALRQRPHGPGQVESEPLGELLDGAGCNGAADLGEVAQQGASFDASFQAQLAGDVPDAAAKGGAAGSG
jgi:hypothetical protein